MKSALCTLTLLLFAITPTFAQEHPTVTAQSNSVYVGADGKFEAAPDTALIQFNVSVQADTAQAAYQHFPGGRASPPGSPRQWHRTQSRQYRFPVRPTHV
jgi:hypothetical protein